MRDILMALYFKYIANKKIYICTAEPLAFGKSRVSEKNARRNRVKIEQLMRIQRTHTDQNLLMKRLYQSNLSKEPSEEVCNDDSGIFPANGMTVTSRPLYGFYARPRNHHLHHHYHHHHHRDG